MTGRVVLAAAAASVAMGLLATSAAVGSSSGWQAAETAARGQFIVDAQLVTGAEGGAVAVWEGGDGAVRASFRDASKGVWRAARLLARGPRPGRRINGFAVAGDRRNRAVLITSSALLTARIGDLQRRRWSSAHVLGRKPVGNPVVTVDGAGNATAVWLRGGLKRAWLSARGSLRTGRWSAPVVIAGAAVSEPQLAVDRSGGVIVHWVRCVDKRPARCGLGRPLQTPELRRYRLELRRRSPVGRWGPNVRVRTVSLTHLLGTRGQRAVLADADGGITLAWINDAVEVVASTLRPGARSWSAPSLLARPRDDCRFDLGPSWPVGGMLRAATNAGGDVLITWICPDFRRDQVGAVTRAAGTSVWTPLALPSRLADATSFNAALANDRTVFLAAKIPAEGEGESRLAGVLPAGAGEWALTDLTFGDNRRASQDHAFVTTEPARAAVAVWTRGAPGSRQEALETVRYLPPTS